MERGHSRWLTCRYSLRTLGIAVTVIAITLGFMAARVEKQRRIVTLIERWGGTVTYRNSIQDRLRRAERVGSQPDCDLAPWTSLPRDLYDHVVAVDASFSRVSDVELSQLRDLS